MFRRNSSLVRPSNSSLDLTPLLDVIFIFLFIVIIGYFEASSHETSEKENLQQQNSELQQQITELQSQEYDYVTMTQNYENSLSQYESLRKEVKIVQIFCNWNEDNVEGPRKLKVITPDGTIGPYEVTEDNKRTRFNVLENELKKYITNNIPKSRDDSLGEKGDPNEFNIIILTLSTYNIRYSDRTAINGIATKLTENYANVYYREFIPDN